MHHPIETETTMDDLLHQAAGYLRDARRVAVLTGAGISAESGVPTFRGGGGLWEGHPIERVATPEGFRRDPHLVWRFYSMRRETLAKVRPNPGHYALVDLEKRFGSDHFALITQNVDGLHRAAGSEHVLELHGTLRAIRCSACDHAEECGTQTLPDLPACPGCGSYMRPAVVWFGEALPVDTLAAAQQAAAECDCFLVVGTSAVVWPAAGLIVDASRAAARVIEVNIEPSEASPLVDVGLYGPSGEVLPRLVELLGKE